MKPALMTDADCMKATYSRLKQAPWLMRSVIISLVMLLLLHTAQASVQLFEIEIHSDADAGGYPNILIDGISPTGGAYVYSTSKVDLDYSVHYNLSTTVLCNLTLDGTVIEQNIATTSDQTIVRYRNISSGPHAWSVHCRDNVSSSNTTPTASFIVDIDAPTITLQTPDYHVSNTHSIDLNFTATDLEDEDLTCSLSINGVLNRTAISVTNDTPETVPLVGLDNGVYDWNVSCWDGNGNLGASEERVFYISEGTPSSFNITPNKFEYSLGQIGYMIINAEPGSNLTMFVSKPKHDSFFQQYTGATFPLVEMINYTDNVGTYSIDGIFSYGGEVYIVRTSFDVTNTFTAAIETNDTSGQPSDVFNFKAVSSGGIGTITYEWDFDDGTTASGEEVEHSFTEKGDYSVKVTATDGKGNKVIDTVDIKVYNKYILTITVKEYQTLDILEGVAVEVDDERQLTDANGKTAFSVYEGKKRIYVSYEGFERLKKIINISEDTELTLEINNTAITNYTRPPEPSEASEQLTNAEESAKTDATNLLAKIEAALESLSDADDAAAQAIAVLNVQQGLEKAKKEIRQIIRDIGNTELKDDPTEQEKLDAITELTAGLGGYEQLAASIKVQDTTEFVDYPKSSDISMLAAEYLDHKGLELSKGAKADYISKVTELQSQVTVTTTMSVVEVTDISGKTKTVAVVHNRIDKSPDDTKSMFFLEYIPKEVADDAGAVTSAEDFVVVKTDPILRFDGKLKGYSYVIERLTTIEHLKKTKHVLFLEADGEDKKGLSSVTGFSFLPNIKIENKKFAFEVALIILLLLAYAAYHFELIDRYRDWRAKKDPSTAPYETDMAYQPESTRDIIIGKINSFINREEKAVSQELAHIRSLLHLTHTHVSNRDHVKAEDTYREVSQHYRILSDDARRIIHPETKQVYSKILLEKINKMLTEAMIYLETGQHRKAKDHYSEIKKLYSKLENEHRAAVSEKCIKLHESIFAASLT